MIEARFSVTVWFHRRYGSETFRAVSYKEGPTSVSFKLPDGSLRLVPMYNVLMLDIVEEAVK